MTLKIDHVTIACSELDPMREAFARVGLATVYGGPHSNNVTHMALLGLRDGSYVELISTIERGNTDHDFWQPFIVGDGGPCAWAVEVTDVEAEARRIAALGVPVVGPTYYYRDRPDGVRVEWDLAFIGQGGKGSQLPFIIKDRTPREWRVQSSDSVSGDEPGLPAGVSVVALLVEDLATAIERYRRVFEWPEPDAQDDANFSAKLAHFTDTPVVLAQPAMDEGWLAERLSRFGEAPCAYLLGTDDFEASCHRYKLRENASWFGRRVAWFGPEALHGVHLGVIA